MRGIVVSLFESFGHRNYRWLWFIVALTNAGSWTFTLAVTWQVYGLTHSSFWSGALMFATLVPNIVGAPIVGVLADQFERKRLILASIVLVLAVFFALIFFTSTSSLSAVGMVTLTLAFGLASSAIGVLVSTVLPSLVPEQDLYNAYSLQALGQRGTEFIGPLMASPLIAHFGVNAAYLLGSLLYAGAILFLMFLRVPQNRAQTLPTVAKQGFVKSLVEGLQYIRKSPTISMMVSLVGLHCALTMAYMGMLPGFVAHHLAANPSFYGELMSMVGLGAIIGTLLLAGIRTRQRQRQLFWMSAVVSGLSLTCLGLSTSPAIAILSILLVGSSQALFMTMALAIIQETTAEHVRGRVTSVYFILAAGLMSLANLGFGGLSKVIPAHLILITSGLIFTLVVGVYSLTSRTFRRVSLGIEVS